MKKIYFLSMVLLVTFTGFAQFTTTTYRGAFAPAPEAMWTDTWTEFDPQNKVYPTPTVTISANITANTTWTAGNTYSLGGQIYVKNNATLTIEPGVIIRSNAAGAGLFVTKGAKLIAEGTVASPIVFTSGNSVGNRSRGDWGGVILLGKGAFNISNGINTIEGIPVIPGNTDTEYGGGLTPDDNDNSGSLKYVRIEYAGYTYGASGSNTEINGLTMGAVGKGTKIDYVQVSYANDDSFEWFGGAVDCSHLVAFNGLDDDFDTDNGFSGKVQFCLAVRQPSAADSSTSNCFESDNNSTSAAGTSFTSAVFSNCTLVGPTYRATLPSGGTLNTNHRRGAHLRRNTQLQIWNSIFMDFVDGLVVDGNTTTANATNGTLKFKNNIIAGIAAAKVAVKVESPTTAFDVAAWFTDNKNTSQTASAGLLTMPYNTAIGNQYTGLDYRPVAGSIAAKDADFTTLANEKFASNAEFSLKVYPNPSTDSFKINYSSSSNEDVKVATYDITGKLVESINVEYADINDQVMGNDYNAGVYILVLKQGNINKSLKVIKK
ncbi:T9SS type A sorting domain-containing protein [Flavobacterium limnophilum]|uniref:T9SS type A sorting domain-containing protein n=1 Tax=Flavobacterium limnophilum TaxID=3003262 RepID=UPI002482A728|nr:T9SS type A sorting domain-containing protein [Flavobacterium limnophilum]